MHLLLIIFVDDAVAASSDKTLPLELIQLISKEFKIKIVDNGCLVGFEIVRHADHSITLHQSSYVKTILKRYNMIDSKPSLGCSEN